MDALPLLCAVVRRAATARKAGRPLPSLDDRRGPGAGKWPLDGDMGRMSVAYVRRAGPSAPSDIQARWPRERDIETPVGVRELPYRDVLGRLTDSAVELGIDLGLKWPHNRLFQ